MKTPETSKLFEKRINAESGAEYYVLTAKACEYQQGFYFVNDSMTTDGRYLWFYATVNPVYDGANRNLGYIDFETDEIVICYDCVFGGGASPYVDVETGDVYFAYMDKLYKRSPGKNNLATVLCTPKIDGHVTRLATHLTRTSDKKHFFLDARSGNHLFVQGIVDIETGEFEKWAESRHSTNHGQINPKNDRLALCAYDGYSDLATGEYYRIPKNEEGIYERLWLISPNGNRRMLPPMNNYATHEWWSADGKTVYYCCDNYGIYGIDIDSGEDITILDGIDPWHAHSTNDDKYFVYDEKKLERYGGKWYRGCPSAVNFYNAENGKLIKIVTEMSENGATPENPNNYHIDPHPRFVCNEKYIVFTTTELGSVDLAVAPVEKLKELVK